MMILRLQHSEKLANIDSSIFFSRKKKFLSTFYAFSRDISSSCIISVALFRVWIADQQP